MEPMEHFGIARQSLLILNFLPKQL